MRTLITLSVLQTIGVSVLIIHTLRDHSRAAPVVHSVTPVAATSAAPYINEQLLRTIIREELALSQIQDVTAPTAAPQPRSATVDLHRRDAIEQQIETYRAMGSITDAQMQELQAEIARLDGASRKEIMSQLLRALNSGDIKGRLQ